MVADSNRMCSQSSLSPVNATATTMLADEEGDTEEMTVMVVVVVVETGTIDIATIAEELEVVDTEGEIEVVRWTIGVTAVAIVIITTVGEEAIDTTTIVDVEAETTSAEVAIDHHIVVDLRAAVETIDVVVVLEVDHHRVVITAETTEEVEGTPEVLLEGAMMIVIGVVMRITEVVAVTMTPNVNVVAPQRYTAETIAEETIAVIVVRDLSPDLRIGQMLILDNPASKLFTRYGCTSQTNPWLNNL